MKIGFVVLHYKVYEMTEECIDTLLNSFSSDDIQIVIVDNGSGNGSGEKLKEKYKKTINVDVILNPENLGFANGNNVGYRYVKEHYNPEFIVVMNNDVLIKEKQFLLKTEEIYKRTEFAVLGPDIQNPIIKNHQNPNRLTPRSYQEVEARYKSFSRRVKLPHVYYLLSVVRHCLNPTEGVEEKRDYKTEKEGVVLHGACFIFSPIFIRNRNNCFNNRTFLYHEEDILCYECIKSGLKMIYSPELSVEHYEDVSTNASFKSEYRKMKMRNTWLRDSAKVLMEVMRQG